MTVNLKIVIQSDGSSLASQLATGKSHYQKQQPEQNISDCDSENLEFYKMDELCNLLSPHLKIFDKENKNKNRITEKDDGFEW